MSIAPSEDTGQFPAPQDLSSPEVRQARLDRFHRHMAEGRSLAWIARQEHLTRWRVSCILGRPYRNTRPRDLPHIRAAGLRILKLADNLEEVPDICTISEFARKVHSTEITVRKHLKTSGKLTQVKKILRERSTKRAYLRARERTRERYLAWGIARSKELGHTFTMYEVTQAHLPYKRVVEVFGSLKRWQRACGLTPNKHRIYPNRNRKPYDTWNPTLPPE